MLYDLIADTHEQRRRRMVTDGRYQAILSATPAEVDNWIQTNLTNIASTKSFIKTLTNIILHLVREVERAKYNS